jgi:hypothetical protein
MTKIGKCMERKKLADWTKPGRVIDSKNSGTNVEKLFTVIVYECS